MFPPDELIYLLPENPGVERGEGGFARSVCILSLAEPMAGGTRSFLAKVLSSVQLDLDKDTLFAEIRDSDPFSFVATLKSKQPAQVLVFGLLPAQLGLAIEPPPYQPFSFYGATWLFADALSVLEPDKDKKGRLWMALKQMFL